MESLMRGSSEVNLSSVERWASLMCGGALLLSGLGRRRGGIWLALIGADLVYRGASGHSYLYQTLGLTSLPHPDRRAPIPYRQGIRVDESITINRPVAELYEFWRRFDNLPYFMEHLLSVTMSGDTRSHWIAKGPAGKNVEWDAEIVNDIRNELIGWRSLPGSEIDTAGSVQFTPAPGNRGTVVKIELQYIPPGGILGALFAKLFGEEPEQQVREDLRHLKQIMEAGEIPSVKGQPRGPGLLELARRARAQAHAAQGERSKLREQAA